MKIKLILIGSMILASISTTAFAGLFDSTVNYETGYSPYSIATGDFNGDGKLDMAVANGGSNTISILIGNGNGTFQPSIDYSFGSGSSAAPVSIFLEDTNNDGKLDILMTDSEGTISVFIGNGDGTFQSPIYYGTGPDPKTIVKGDFNGDGITDWAQIDWWGDRISVSIGNGDGSFQTPMFYSTGQYSGPNSITSGDFNGDGLLDISVANGTNNTVSVFLGNGDGTFQPKIDFPTGWSPNFITTADFNGDGKTDLAVTNRFGYSVSILLNVYGLPTGSITINNGAESTNSSFVILSLSACDDGVVNKMRFSNDNTAWSSWEPYSTSKKWTLTSGYGTKTVYVQFEDDKGNMSRSYSDSIYLVPSTPAEVAAIVSQMVANGAINNKGFANALISSLNHANMNIASSPISARSMLEAVINMLQAQSGKQIDTTAAQTLIGYINNIISTL